MGGGQSRAGPSRRDKKSGKKTGTKRALLVGCNYPKTRAELAGCVNDVENWQQLLTEQLDFDPWNIKILVDEGTEHELATGKNIKRELSRIVAESRPGDIVFFQFSGHGVQVPADEGGDYEEDGLDEALCPTDLNLIVDDDLRDILSGLNSDVKFTMVSDCCHSGGMLDHEQIVISGGSETNETHKKKTKDRGISVDEMMDEMAVVRESQGKKNRALDLETMADMLQDTATQKESIVDQHKIRETLYDVYGQDSSNAALAMKTRDITPDQAQRIHYAGPGKKPANSLIDPNKGILITGCQSHETSADVTGADGRSFGALSHTITRIVRRHKKKYGKRPISNHELVLKVRQLLDKSGFEQNPCLECSVKNANSNFVLW